MAAQDACLNSMYGVLAVQVQCYTAPDNIGLSWVSLPSMASDGFKRFNSFDFVWIEVRFLLTWDCMVLDSWILRYSFHQRTWILTSTVLFSMAPARFLRRDTSVIAMSVSREHCMERVWRGWLCVWSLLIFSRNGTCYIWLFFRNIGWRFPAREFLQHMSVCACANIAVMKTSVPNIKCHWHRQSFVNMKSIKPTKPNAHDNLGLHAVWMYMIYYTLFMM